MRVPLYVITGFLGTGKTTLLARLLAHPGGPRTAVLVNEVGEVSLDHHLVERVDDELSVLSSGCICCTLRGALADRLTRVLALAPERIVLETTGLANPAPVLHALGAHPDLSTRLRLGATIVTLDALRGEPLIDAHPEARAQLGLADRVVLTKVDLASADRIEAIEARARAEAPGAEVLTAVNGEVDPARLLNEAPLAALDRAATVERWLHHHPHHGEDEHGVETEVWDLGQEVDSAALALWLRLVTQLDGPRLLRIKGIVQATDGATVLLQSAEHAVAPPRTLTRAPEGWSGSKLVLITRGLPAGVKASLRSAAESAARGERRRDQSPR